MKLHFVNGITGRSYDIEVKQLRIAGNYLLHRNRSTEKWQQFAEYTFYNGMQWTVYDVADSFTDIYFE